MPRRTTVVGIASGVARRQRKLACSDDAAAKTRKPQPGVGVGAARAIIDPEVPALAMIATTLEAEYASDPLIWNGSPFAWIKGSRLSPLGKSAPLVEICVGSRIRTNIPTRHPRMAVRGRTRNYNPIGMSPQTF